MKVITGYSGFFYLYLALNLLQSWVGPRQDVWRGCLSGINADSTNGNLISAL